MARTNIKRKNWLRKRIRTKLSLGRLGNYPRLVIFRSNKHIYGQLVDDVSSSTILSASTKCKSISSNSKSGSKIEQSKLVGYELAEKIKKSKIEKIIYDRNGYKYHGRVKALAEAIREKGINF
tara:strand:- start:236 stop:604 length:369 start_codon:yes stop_codon:yes gene_type:complete